jgi:DNA-binding XRE family transcriptional regulator
MWLLVLLPIKEGGSTVDKVKPKPKPKPKTLTPAEEYISRHGRSEVPRDRYKKDGFITKIRELREALGISQVMLADALGVDQPQISLWERGMGIGLEMALKIAHFFGLKVEDIWQLKEK